MLDERREREREVRPSRVVGRATDGRTLRLDLAGECVQAEGTGGYVGEVVTQLPSLANRNGTAGVPVMSSRGLSPLLDIDHLEPSLLPRGVTGLAVTVVGTGFTPATLFDFLRPGTEEVNPGIEISGRAFVDAEHFTLTLNVASDAEIYADGSAPMAFEDPARLF